MKDSTRALFLQPHLKAPIIRRVKASPVRRLRNHRAILEETVARWRAIYEATGSTHARRAFEEALTNLGGA